MKSKRIQIAILVVLVGLLAGLYTQQQALRDWWRLRGYTAPADVAQLASDDAMTNQARHLFYVNRPVITSGKTFTSHCPTGGEKTVVLGCYIGPDAGIYVYDVTDTRLNGVEQVTAAHEMLHAAYGRLSGGERKRVDAMLMDYYQHDLADQRIKDTIDSYKKSEPNDVVNEMHSVFGTEVAQLPSGLEQYYKQYFSDRAKVAGYTAKYQGEFTSRQAEVASADAQLKVIKQQVDANSTQLDQQKAAIDKQNTQLQAQRNSGQIAAYNSGVAAYNQAVNSYNILLSTTKNLIKQYNDIVDHRNAVALEEQQLAQALSADSLPSK